MHRTSPVSMIGLGVSLAMVTRQIKKIKQNVLWKILESSSEIIFQYFFLRNWPETWARLRISIRLESLRAAFYLMTSHGRDRPICLQSGKFRVGSSRGSSRDAVFRKSSSIISRLGAPKVLENTSKLEFSSFFIVCRLQLEHQVCTDESISENFEFE